MHHHQAAEAILLMHCVPRASSSATPHWICVFSRSVVHHAEHTLATDRYNFDMNTAYQSVAYSVRDYLVESLRDTKAHYVKEDPKRVYYLSLEFLMGRSLLNSLMNLDLEKPYKEALEEIGFKLEDLV